MIHYLIFGFGLMVVMVVGGALAFLIVANNRGLTDDAKTAVSRHGPAASTS